MEEVEAVQHSLTSQPASPVVYEKRTDLPVMWAGPGGEYLPQDVQNEVLKRFPPRKKDEL